MKKNVITMGRQFGSGGREIGKRLSSALGFSFYDEQLITMAAQRAEVREELFAGKEEKAANPWLFTAVYEGGPRVQQGKSAEDILFQMQSEIIAELGRAGGCVIVGRCADAVLEKAGIDCLRLFICAPFEWRVRHRLELEQMDEKAMAAQVEKIDKQRAKYYSYYTGRHWGAPENYDLCVNSARLGIDQTSSLLAEHCRQLFSGLA